MVVTGWSVEGVALELFDEFAELGRETVHGALEARQEIERHDDREAYGRNRGQEILFHLASSCQVVRDGPGRGWRWRCRLGSGLGGGEGARRERARLASGELLFLYRPHDGLLERRRQRAFDDDGLLGDDVIGPFLSLFARQVLARVEERDGFRLSVVESEGDFKGTFHGEFLLSRIRGWLQVMAGMG